MEEGGIEETVEFGNPLQSGGGGKSVSKRTTWKPASEQSQEDVRRQRLLISNFDSLVQKLRAGRKEHEFVACLADIELFCKIKAADVPANGQELLCDTRDALVKNGRRGQFWRQKAKAAFQTTLDAVPVQMKKDTNGKKNAAALADAPKAGSKKAPVKAPAVEVDEEVEEEGEEEEEEEEEEGGGDSKSASALALAPIGEDEEEEEE